MAITFFHQFVLPNDAAGWGMWLTEHYYEHIRFILTGRGLAEPVEMVEYDILSWSDEPSLVQGWLGAHQLMHQSVREVTGITGTNLQQVDFTNEGQFLEWLDSHSQEHKALEEALGAT